MHKTRIYPKAIILVIVFHVINFIQWFQLDIWPQGKDYYCHLDYVFKMINNLDSNLSIKNLIFVTKDYPPVFYWVSASLIYLFNKQYNACFFAPIIFLIFLIISVYKIGVKLKNNETGILTAVFCSFLPIIYQSTLQFNFALATTAMVSLTILILLNTENLKKQIFN